jgi:hypothetical protein
MHYNTDNMNEIINTYILGSTPLRESETTVERLLAATLLFKDKKETVTCLNGVAVSLFLYAAEEDRYAATCYVAKFYSNVMALFCSLFK